MKNAVIYARYSAGSKQTEQSIEGQLRVCTEYAEKNDLRIVGTYIDRKISGKTDNRREFQRMIDDSGKKIFEVVVMYQTDRFARNRYDSAVYKHILRKNGVELKYATTNIPEGPEGIILESLMEGLAEYYSAELSQKIKRGMRESALKCHSTGAGHSLGYRTAPDKSIVIEPDGAKAVQIIFDMYIKGRSQVEICDHLNGLGLRTVQGKPFGKNSINKIIKNKRYIGVYSYDDIVIEANDQQFREWVTEKNHSDYLRRCENGIETVSLYSDIMSECGSGEELICDPVDIEEEIVKKLRCQALRAAMAELSSENYYLLQKLYFEKNRASERDLAKEFGISQPAIHRRKKKILKNLKLLVIKFEKSQQYIVKGKKRSLSTEP